MTEALTGDGRFKIRWWRAHPLRAGALLAAVAVLGSLVHHCDSRSVAKNDARVLGVVQELVTALDHGDTSRACALFQGCSGAQSPCDAAYLAHLRTQAPFLSASTVSLRSTSYAGELATVSAQVETKGVHGSGALGVTLEHGPESNFWGIDWTICGVTVERRGEP